MNTTYERAVTTATQPHSTRPLEARFDSVVVLSPFFWNYRDDMWQTTHNVAIALARLLPTFFVEPTPVWNPGSEQFRLHRLFDGLLSKRIDSPRPNLEVFRRRSFPLGRLEPVRNFDLRRNARALRKALRRRGFARTLLWHSFPYWSGHLVEAIQPSGLVYHSLDYSDREEEGAIVKRADIVLCVSEALVRKHKVLNPRTHLMPNGVDLTLFRRHDARGFAKPSDLPSNGRVIGFVGSINCHLDFDLLVSVAKAYPGDTLTLVGRVSSNETAPRGNQVEALEKLHALPNVRFLGFKPTDQLANYIQSFDVCLIPFLENQFNQECDPLKFYQYLALGKPIVSTPVPAAQRNASVCYVASTPEQFLGSIRKAFDETEGGEILQKRLQLAESHSWDSLVGWATRLMAETAKTEVTIDRWASDRPPSTEVGLP